MVGQHDVGRHDERYECTGQPAQCVGAAQNGQYSRRFRTAQVDLKLLEYGRGEGKVTYFHCTVHAHGDCDQYEFECSMFDIGNGHLLVGMIVRLVLASMFNGRRTSMFTGNQCILLWLLVAVHEEHDQQNDGH